MDKYEVAVEARKKATGGGDVYADITVESVERDAQEQGSRFEREGAANR